MVQSLFLSVLVHFRRPQAHANSKPLNERKRLVTSFVTTCSASEALVLLFAERTGYPNSCPEFWLMLAKQPKYGFALLNFRDAAASSLLMRRGESFAAI